MANRKSGRNMGKFSGRNVRQNASLRTGNRTQATGHGISRRRFLGTTAAGVGAMMAGRGRVAHALMPTDVQAKTLYAQINGQRMWELVEYFSSPAFGGRQAGSQGNYDAANYIAQQFGEWGLRPGGDNGSYFDNFELLEWSRPVDPAQFVINDIYGTFTLSTGDDYNIDWYSDSVSLTGAEVEYVFVGLPDDYEGKNVAGKLVLVVPIYPDIEGLVETVHIQCEVAKAHGAAGIIMWAYGMYNGLYKYAPNTTGLSLYTMPGFAKLVVSHEVGLKLYTDYVLHTRYGFPAASINLTTTMEHENHKGIYNVIGEIPGADPFVGDEVIIVAAHFDGQGTQPGGTLFPSAQDHASGTAVVMEIAKVLASGNFQPKRTIRFICFNAEEWPRLVEGTPELTSTGVYIDSLSDLEKQRIKVVLYAGSIAYEINPSKEFLLEGGLEYGWLMDFIEANAEELNIIRVDEALPPLGAPYNIRPVGLAFGNDPYMFHTRGFTVVAFDTPMSNEITTYHGPYDTADTVDPFYMQQVGRLLAGTLLELAMSDNIATPEPVEVEVPSGLIYRQENLDDIDPSQQ